MGQFHYLGFDPGGVGTFGWAVAVRAGDATPRIIATGRAPNAKVAVETSLGFLGSGDKLAGVGIDAPLFWSATGARKADSAVRYAIYRLGAKHASGTVQQLNSLRGACLVQGVTAATLVRRLAPRTLVTETHPKALLWLLGLATQQRAPKEIQLGDLTSVIEASARSVTEHERDSVISCVATVAHHENRPDWFDLAACEPDRIDVVPGGAAYWIPQLSATG